jgi:hypothetical protein
MKQAERALLEELREGLQKLASLDKDPAAPDTVMAYAFTLGRANGIAKGLLIAVECRLGVSR